MKLSDWLEEKNVKRVQFAQRIGVTPQSITGYCGGEFLPRKQIMQRIFDETGGDVTPNDFMLSAEGMSA